MPDELKQIQKPWAVYGVISKFIGRIVEENSSSVGIQYREGQLFSLRLGIQIMTDLILLEAINYLYLQEENTLKEA